MASAIVPPIFDPEARRPYGGAIDRGRIRMANTWDGTEGLLVGISAAAAVASSLKIAEEVAAREIGSDRDGAARFGGQVFERAVLGGMILEPERGAGRLQC